MPTTAFVAGAAAAAQGPIPHSSSSLQHPLLSSPHTPNTPASPLSPSTRATPGSVVEGGQFSSPIPSPQLSPPQHHSLHSRQPFSRVVDSVPDSISDTKPSPRRPRVPDPAKKVTGKDELHSAITRQAVAEQKLQAVQLHPTPRRRLSSPDPLSSPTFASRRPPQITPDWSPPSSPYAMSIPHLPHRPGDRMPAMAHRTASIDSTVSSISSTNSHRANPSTNTFRVPQDVQGPQDAAALIASAGSAEAALHKVLGEKQQAANHNAQLWRLVEKQRAMILGLNRDLEKSLKEKERYRRKLKDHLAQSSSAPALTSSNISQSPRQFVSTPTSARDISVDTLKTSDTSGSVPNSAVGRSDTPQDATAPQSARLENTQTRNEFQREPEPSAPASGDTNAAFQSPKSPKSPASPHPSSGYASPKTRKAPPAPLKLTSNEPQIEIVNHIIDASDSEYEEDPTSARSEHADRGRRKTREDDDREREVLLQKEVEQRSRSKKEKKSKSRPGEKIDVPLAAAGEPPVDEAARLQGPFFQPASSDDFRDPIIVDGDHGTPSQRLQVVTHSGLLSPGLPLSPRPGDRPPNSPMPRAPNGQVANSIPLSPRAGMNGGMPLSPRAPRAPIPLPPQTPISLMSPHLDRAKAYAQQTSSQTQSPSVPADRLRSNSEQSPDNAPSSMSSDHFSLHTPGEIYRGLQTEQYPDLLLPPNALASIYVKIASSRMIRSRASMIAPRIADDNPVFTMSVHARSDNKELWRIEKTFASLWALDHEVKSMTKMRAPMPDKTLFTGHAPAKIDARRMVLNAYFERMLDAVTEEKAARVICKFLSTDSFAGDGGDYFGTVSDVRRPESPAQKLRTNMAGYLTKRGKNFGGWKARYFVLDGPNFKYYEGPGGAHLGSIKLPNAQIGKQSINPNQSSNDDEDNQFRHAFLILEPKKKDSSSLVRHVLCAESDEERDQWVDALLHYVDYKEDEDQQPWRQAQVSKVEPTVPYSPRSPRLQKSTQDLRAGNSGSSGHGRSADLHAVGYNETVAGNAPVMGTTPATRTSDTPSPPYDKLVADSAPHPLISAPTNLQVIQNTGEWGMKVPPTPGKDRKRSVFQLPFGRGRSSSDLDPSEAMRSPGVKAPERPYREPSRAVFGLPLAEAVEVAHPEAMAAELPSVVYRCIQYLTARNAVAEEGIFRLSGSNTVIRSLKERFSTEGDINLLEDEISYDIHAVASLLKLYLRELPASILTRDFHLDFLHCLEMQHDEKVAAVRALVHKLPRPNFALLDTLSAFMLLIVKNVSVNKMNVRNLGVVFSPTLNLPGPLISLFVEEQHSIFGAIPEGERDGQNSTSSPVQAPASGPTDSRSPRRQMLSDLPASSYYQAGNSYADDATISYASYQMAPQGDGGYGSLNEALRSPTVYSTTGTGAPSRRELKQKRRESSMLTVNNAMEPHRKSSQSRLREEHGTEF